MRRARIKVAAEKGDAVYHCISRTVNGERLLDDTAKEVLRQQLWQVADFCGLKIVTYTVLSNHFHVLVRVPQTSPVPDQELLRRYRVLYPHPTRHQTARLEVVQAQLDEGGPEAEAWRRRNLSLMNDVSAFMKLLKQRFTIWYNHAHARFGTLWAERFKSVLIEPHDRVLRTVAAYIDLNAVRAGLVRDPKDYRFCAYAEAVAGKVAARAGLSSVVPGRGWRGAHSAYRQLLFGHGSEARHEAAAIDPTELGQVIAQGGNLPLSTVLRCRWRYFSDGAVLGSAAFVASHRHRLNRGAGLSPSPTLPPVTDWGALSALHRLNGAAWG